MARTVLGQILLQKKKRLINMKTIFQKLMSQRRLSILRILFKIQPIRLHKITKAYLLKNLSPERKKTAKIELRKLCP